MQYQYHKGEVRASMNKAHAQVMERGERRMPRKNEVCDMSCEFAFACANYNDNGTCVGFQLLSNGKLERHIKRNLDEHDRNGIQRYIEMIQETSSPQILNDLTPVVYRFLKKPEKEQQSTMIGLQRYLIVENQDGTRSLTLPPKPPKPNTPKSLTSQEELRFHSRNQNRIKRGEN